MIEMNCMIVIETKYKQYKIVEKNWSNKSDTNVHRPGVHEIEPVLPPPAGSASEQYPKCLPAFHMIPILFATSRASCVFERTT